MWIYSVSEFPQNEVQPLHLLIALLFRKCEPKHTLEISPVVCHKGH